MNAEEVLITWSHSFTTLPCIFVSVVLYFLLLCLLLPFTQSQVYYCINNDFVCEVDDFSS